MRGQIAPTHRLVVQPEGEPGDGDGHGAGHVDGDHKEGELPGKHEVHLQAGVLACNKGQCRKNIKSAHLRLLIHQVSAHVEILQIKVGPLSAQAEHLV